MATGACKALVLLLIATAAHSGVASANHASQALALRQDPKLCLTTGDHALLRLRGGGVSDLFSCCLPANAAAKPVAVAKKPEEKPEKKLPKKNAWWKKGMMAVVPVGILYVIADLVQQLQVQ